MARERVYSGNISASKLQSIIKSSEKQKKEAKETIKQADINIRGAKKQLKSKK